MFITFDLKDVFLINAHAGLSAILFEIKSQNKLCSSVCFCTLPQHRIVDYRVVIKEKEKF